MVCEDGPSDVESITSLSDVRLVTLNGRRTGTRNIALKALAAIAGEQLEILLCQASSQYDVCFAVRPEFLDRTVRALQRAFDYDRRLGPVVIDSTTAMVAVRGSGLSRTPGVAARIFSTLSSEGINILAITDGGSPSGLIFLVEDCHGKIAINSLLQEFEVDNCKIGRR